MIFIKFLKFFYNQARIFDYVIISVNYFLIFIISFFEIFFISTVYLILNFDTNLSEAGKITSYLIGSFNDLSIYFNIDLLNMKIISLIFILTFKNFLSIFQNWFFLNYIYSLSAKKSKEIYKNFLFLKYQKFIKNNISSYIKIIMKDLDNVYSGIFSCIISILGDLFYILIVLFFSFSIINMNFYSDHLFLIILLIFMLRFVAKRSFDLGTIKNTNETNLFKQINEGFSSIIDLKIFNKINMFGQNFYQISKKYYDSRVNFAVINALPKAFFEITILVFFYIAFKASENSLLEFLSSITILALVFLRIIPPISRIASNFGASLNFHESLRLVKDISKTYTHNKKNISKIKNNLDKIHLKNISFSYKKNNKIISRKKDNKIIKNFNYTFEKNKIYGIYGNSGKGKTTLLHLIAGLIEPTEGKIYGLRKNKLILKPNMNLGFLNQNPVILDFSILQNVTLKFENKKKEIFLLKYFIKKFNLNKFLNSKFLMNTSLSTSKKLSGGEKQRIAFIRTIFNSPQIILLDEPTSSLDKKNENKLLSYLDFIKKDKIIIVTSHQDSQKKYFDKIINFN